MAIGAILIIGTLDANAGLVNVRIDGHQQVPINYNQGGTSKSTRGGKFWGEVLGGPFSEWTGFLSWCIEPEQTLGRTETLPFQMSPLLDVMANPANHDDALSVFAQLLGGGGSNTDWQLAAMDGIHEADADMIGSDGHFWWAGIGPYSPLGSHAYPDVDAWVLEHPDRQDTLFVTARPTTTVPIPATGFLFGSGLLLLRVMRRNRAG